jgi:hypothetical protein
MATPKSLHSTGDIPLFKRCDSLNQPLASISNEAGGLTDLSDVLSNISCNIAFGMLYQFPE